MKRRRITSVLTGLVVFSLAVLSTSASVFTQRFTEASGSLLIADARPPSRNGDGTNNFIRVTSKCNMCRDTNGTSPHIGVDMTMPAGTRVYPAFRGKVSFVDHDVSDQNAFVVMNQDIDGNGTYDGYYFVYRHIDPDDDVIIGDVFEVMESFAAIDIQRPNRYSPHLHYGWTQESDSDIAKSTSRFYSDESTYWYGRDYDFFARDYWSHNTLYINAYSKNGDTRQNVTEVEAYCKVGGGSWSDVPKQMTLNDSGNYQWRFDFGTISGITSGTEIQFYLVGYRNVTGYDNWSLWPQFYEHPPILPSDFTQPIKYKSKTIVDDYGNTMGASTLAYVGSRLGVISYLDDIDVFRFVPTTSRSYTFRTTGSTDTFGTLYDSSSVILGYDDDSGEGNNFQINETLFYGQTYYIYVQHYSPTQTGTYTLWIE